MAVSDANANTSEAEKPAKETQKPKERKERPLTKVVVRRLPPSMDQESFILQVSPLPDYDYMYTVKGDMSLGENAFARVYINFVNASDIFMFKEKFDNYVFVDQKGHEYAAVVEFASFQKTPRKRKPRPDPKSGTIESDPYYMEFLESLKEQPNQDEKPEFSYQFEGKEEIASTPLLDYIKQKRIDKQRIREERREERRRKELERKKLREDERKRHEQKSAGKSIVKSNTSSRTNKAAALDSVKEEASEKSDLKAKSDDEKDDSLSEKNISPSSTSREPKYEDRKPFSKPKPRFPHRSDKPDFSDRKSEYKRREDYREKEYRSRRFDDYKKESDTKETPRKTKKYSEKREERKNEARKAEQRKMEALEKSDNKSDNVSNLDQPKAKPESSNKSAENAKTEKIEEKLDRKKRTTSESTSENTGSHSQQQVHTDEDMQDAKSDRESKNKLKEHDPRAQRRIRNKDRPTMAIYQPGMLSKRKTVDGNDTDSSNANKE